MNHSIDSGRIRRGFTLVELMVVISVIAFLAAMAMTTILPAMDKRRMRESARMVATMLSQARSKAIETGRPYGVWIQRLNEGPTGMDLSFVQVPTPYAGGAWDTRAVISGNSCTFQGDVNIDQINTNDLIRFGIQGQMFRVDSASGNSVQFSATTGGTVPNTAGGQQAIVPFQVFRRPRRAYSGGISLPEPTVVDLSQSSIGEEVGVMSSGGERILIMFSPRGGIDSVDLGGGNVRRPTAPVFLLIGKNDKAGAENLDDLENLWISIGFQSGAITVAENLGTADGGDPREFARSGSSMGGR